jgi:Holliday junction resolvasome RuvABC endonuclease subunit
MALAKGSAAAAIISQGIPVTLFTPQQAKRAATGNPSADKEDVKAEILIEFDYFKNWIKSSKGRLIKTANEHIFDACSVLMCARNTETYKEL